jgi:hypothetical protein
MTSKSCKSSQDLQSTSKHASTSLSCGPRVPHLVVAGRVNKPTTPSTGWNASLTAHDQQESTPDTSPYGVFSDHTPHYFHIPDIVTRWFGSKSVGCNTSQILPKFQPCIAERSSSRSRSTPPHPHYREGRLSQLTLPKACLGHCVCNPWLVI